MNKKLSQDHDGRFPRPETMAPWLGLWAVSKTFVATAVVCTALLAPRLSTGAVTREVEIVESAAAVLDDTMSIRLRAIPSSMLANAQGIVIIPKLIKGGFVVGARRGEGVALTRAADGSWQGPVFVTLTGGSVGWQAGVQSTDLILIFKSRTSIESLMQGKLTVGADAAAAAGPVGRNAAAATDGMLQAEIYSYSRSRGLFAGVSIDGSVLKVDNRATDAYFAPPGHGQAEGASSVPESATALIRRIVQYSDQRATVERPVRVDEISALPEPTTENSQESELAQAGRQLAAASSRLAPLLDAGWKRYLVIPNTGLEEGQPVSTDALQQSIERFDRVAADRTYRTLTDRTEFQNTHQALHDYLRVLQDTTTKRHLPLPAPPDL